MSEWSFQAEVDAGPIVVRPLTAERFGDLEQVFGDKGVARRCFCMYWRRPDGGFGDQRDNRDRFREVVDAQPPAGLIGYLDREPIGWVQVGPRSDFPTLARSRLLRPVDDTDPWSINCFVVRAGRRRRGVAGVMLEAAIDYAAGQGAEMLEAYPVDGTRSSVTDYFTGTLSMFVERGFVEVTRRNDTRPVVRLVPEG